MIKKALFGIIAIFITFLGLSAFASTTSNATFPHWQKSSIDVYIPNDEKAASMQRAFQKWQGESGGNLNFKFVENGPADIDVVFTEQVGGNDGPIGSYSVKIRGMKITKAEIKILSGSKAKKYSNNHIYTVMLHEVGHALGMQDEPRKPTSIMYMPVSEKQDIQKFDVKKLYKINGWSYAQRNFNN
ncbi:MAG: matrixin family metalloprotease [Candidatus Gastranaerophilales bacterium]|nr:matrixin family metalloprotease [Candidatus Gastranaerophilales bacterium]